MKDARIPEKPVASVPKTGDDPLKPILLLALCAVTAVAWIAVTIRRRKRRKADEKE